MNKVAVFVALGVKIINSSEKKARNSQSQIVYTTKMHETRVLIPGSFFLPAQIRIAFWVRFFTTFFRLSRVNQHSICINRCFLWPLRLKTLS